MKALTPAIHSEGNKAPLPPAAGAATNTGKLVRNVLLSLEDSKAEQIVSIDLTGKTSLADVMFVASGRSGVHVGAIASSLGYRHRTNDASLPGKPDLVFRKSRKVILVHGCFWHRHRCRAGRVSCATNSEFWRAKFAANVRRDRRNIRDLRALGWSVLVVWECATRQANADHGLQNALQLWIEGDSPFSEISGASRG